MNELKSYRVPEGGKFKLNKIKPDDLGDFTATDEARAVAGARVAELVGQTAKLQERLYAESRQALLIVLQAMDAGGKDGTIKQVMSGVNPQSCRVTSFKVPSTEERTHDFLWRIHKEVPPKGFIGIFNRSHYEDILWPRVHGELTDKVMKQRLEQLMDFERMLTETGTTIVKLYLHISKAQQQRRLQRRVDNPEKHWKYNPGDLTERKLWLNYMDAYNELLARTSTKHAPWYIIPADNKWYRDYLVATLIRDTLKAMKPRYPEPQAGVDFSTLKIV
jgi:PPK2 family polyphosphate:nucleotide phosphotransferase